MTEKPNTNLRWMALCIIMQIALLLTACGAPAAAPIATPIPPTPVPPTVIPESPTLIPTTPPQNTTTPTAPDTDSEETLNAFQIAMTADAAEQSAKPTPTPYPPDKPRMEFSKITSEALAGNLLGDSATRNFVALLPAGYDTTEDLYPVVYVLHWYSGGEVSMVAKFENTLRQIGDEVVQDMIYIFPDASNVLGGSWYLSSPTIGDYETYLTQELVDFVDANYRTIPNRDSRGITGCSMGGDGSVHLALTYPDVFAVVAGVSGIYDYERDPIWETARSMFKETPSDLSTVNALPWQVQNYLAAAAAAAPNQENPPFYFDMPFEVVGDEAQIVSEVMAKIYAADPVHDVHEYLDQSVRLNDMMIYHGKNDPHCPIDVIRDFDEMLTDLGVDHEYLEVSGGHCSLSYEPILQFMSEHLAHEMSGT